jgi:HK97 family phage major capsid protein
MELKDQLEALKTELKGYFEKAAEQQKAQGTVTEELKSKIDALQKQADALDVKLAERHAAAQPEETLEESLKKNDDLAGFMRKKSGNVVIEISAKHASQIMERKTTIDSAAVGVSTSGVLRIDRIPGIVEEARQALTIRNLLTSRPTSMQVIDFVKVNSPLVAASPQIETHTKLENAVTFTTASERVRTLATWIPASRQILDDFTELMAFLQSSLPYYVNLAEEQQLLTGSGSGEDLNGLITQATAYDTALTPAGPGWNRIDIIGRVIQQITTAKELQPTFIVLNPVDWWSIRLTKDTQGRYILGDPMGPVSQQQLFGLDPVVTTTVTSGQFLVGSGSPIAAEIRDRMGMAVEISTSHEDYFARNMVALRAERRLALVVRRPSSFVKGTFTTSP